jgi:hypothetical protein
MKPQLKEVDGIPQASLSLLFLSQYWDGFLQTKVYQVLEKPALFDLLRPTLENFVRSIVAGSKTRGFCDKLLCGTKQH